MNHYQYTTSGGLAGALPASTAGSAPVHNHPHLHQLHQPRHHQHQHQHQHLPQNQLPIAPSPHVAAGHKRKLVPSSSASIVNAAARSAVATDKSSMPRRDTAPAIIGSPVKAAPSPAPNVSPSDYWKGLLNEWRVPILDTVGIEQDSDDTVDFLETTPERIESYQNIELLTAVRRRDLATLKRIAAEKAANNSTMNACNRFGESILHLACRKGSLDVVQLLVGEGISQPLPGCDCSLLVRDDYGRTVLHDACWTISPPWELVKLILKKAPVLWRVSDVRGHLALQYVPKSVWPQWIAFLTKNKDLLKRVMVHAYHRVDIAHQPMPQETSRQPTAGAPLLSRLPGSLPQSSAVPVTSAPAGTASGEPKASPSLPLSAAQTSTRSSGPSTIAQQANAVLARALAQANPAMVQALSMGVQPRQLKQGVEVMPPVSTSHQATPQTQATLATQGTVHAQALVPAAPAPGPATAALDEALKAQAEMRAQKRSELQGAAPERLIHKPLVKQEAHKVRLPPPPNESKQAPLPYAPSISMIAKRLAGYQKATAIKDAQLKQKQETLRLQKESRVQTSSEIHAVRNPLPAVPNPLLTTSENEAVLKEVPKAMNAANQPVVAEATTTQHTTAVPNPIILAGEEASVVPSAAPIENSSEEATAGIQIKPGMNSSGSSNSNCSNNSASSLTMSGSASEAEQQETFSTTTTTTNTVSENMTSKVSASVAATATDPANDSTVREDGSPEDSEGTGNKDEKEDKDGVSSISDTDYKSDLSETKKRIVG
mmetsp:Transcript_9166/g.22288  ORF Transcript_9166/g.22288 Transcript_9166/m.22288 type:complete len:772 (-) Transcript_9166:415-2730(-)